MEIRNITINPKKFEAHNFLIKILRIIAIPILNNIPKVFLKKMAGASSKDASKIIGNVGSTHALEVMYSRHSRKLLSRGILQGIADFVWHHVISQLKAVRNRLKIVEIALEEELSQKIKNGQTEISILTVGGGSCRAIIHTVSRLLKKHPEINIKVTNIDKDARAIELGKKISGEFNVNNYFNWINDSASNIKDLIPESSMDIVEMVGLLDYFDYEKGKNILTQINNTLREDSYFIVANVYPNSEIKFVENVDWPKMCYRTKEDFIKLIKDSGFSKLETTIEPLRVHIIGLARK